MTETISFQELVEELNARPGFDDPGPLDKVQALKYAMRLDPAQASRWKWLFAA